MEVSNWLPLPPTVNPVRTAANRRSRISPRWVGLIGTLLVHALVLDTVMLGSHSVKIKPPDRQGAGVTLVNAGVTPVENLILIDIPATQTDEPPMSPFASLGRAPQTATIIISADSAPHVDIPKENTTDAQDSSAAVTSGDPAGQARLFGLYSGQIHARIERAWRRPRTPIHNASEHRSSDEPFRCQVQIIQDSIGIVQEVLLPNCPGSFTWQRSLVIAIQQASPLPSPPDPSVFSRAVTLEFVGFTYGPGADDSEYDIAPGTLAQRLAQ